jgi:hypothetical protein
MNEHILIRVNEDVNIILATVEIKAVRISRYLIIANSRFIKVFVGTLC